MSRAAALGLATLCAVSPAWAAPCRVEQEPNDSPAAANPLEGASCIEGVAEEGQLDYFSWSLTPEEAAQAWHLRVLGPRQALTKAKVVALDAAGAEPQEGRAFAEVAASSVLATRSPGLTLPAGTHLIWVAASKPGSYRVELESRARRHPSAGDHEPNDDAAHASPMSGAFSFAGDLAGSEDWFAWKLGAAEAKQRWRVSLRGPSGSGLGLTLYGSRSRNLAEASAGEDGGAALEDLGLEAGTYRIALAPASDSSAPYELRAEPVGVRAPDLEDEPNDATDLAKRLETKPLRMRGRLTPGDLGDYTRLDVQGAPQLWRIEALGLGLGVSLCDAAGNVLASRGALEELGQAVLNDLFLPPGDHWLHVAGEPGREYTLRATPLGPPDPEREREPNDDEEHAELLSFGATRKGRLPDSEDGDLYRFSVGGDARAMLRVELPNERSGLEIQVWRDGISLAELRIPPGQRSLEHLLQLSPGEYSLRLYSAGTQSEDFYRLRLALADPFAPPPAALPLRLSLDLPGEPVAAHFPGRQRLRGAVTLTSESGEQLSLTLDARTSSDAWAVKLGRSALELAPRATVRIPLGVGIGADVSARVPVQIAVRARTEGGAARTTLREIGAAIGAAPVAAARANHVPRSLLGGLDAAWLELGAEPLGPPAEEFAQAQRELFDGIAPTQGGFWSTLASVPLEFGVDLAGEDLVPVAGVAFALTGPGAASLWAHEIDVLLSEDGDRYVLAASTSLRPATGEQYVVLEEPVPARFARLRIRSNRTGSREGIALAEWKVITSPGSQPLGAASFDLAEPRLGGHVVWASPPYGESESDFDAILDGSRPVMVTVPAASTPRFVIGFHHGRAAKIVRLEWRETERPVPAFEPERLSEVEIEVSTESPLGPWRPLGRWTLPGEPGDAKPFVLPSPVWARYVRFSAPSPAPSELALVLPERIGIIEQAQDASYRSILGEWGLDGSQGPYEAETSPADETPALAEAARNDGPGEAQLLAAGATARGVVYLGRDEDWYQVATAADANTLSVELEGEPTVAAEVEVQDVSGAVLPLRRAFVSASRMLWKARVEPSRSYRLRVFDPKRSVVVAFDASTSMGLYLGTLRRGLAAFATGLEPGREVVNVMPFDKDLVLADWTDQAFAVQSGLRSIRAFETSSDAEKTLLQASEELSQRPGTKAIVLMTDADTTSFPESEALWRALERVRPRIFAVHVGGAGDPPGEQDLMQDWASVNGGHYAWIRGQPEIDTAFDRAAAWLRRPASYVLRASSANEPPPGPGGLRITSAAPLAAGEAPAPGSGAVELVLDASGSMLQPFEGRRRIDVARDVLTEVVEKSIPPGSLIALRAFGHTEPHSCQTVLESGLDPLDAAALAARIAAIEPVNLAKTPIADSLRQVAVDLDAARAGKTVVLVTDGEETCGGDPEAEIRALRGAGFEVRVNIVGFAVADDAVKQQFRAWARAGDGEYFDAKDSRELAAAVAKAVRVPFVARNEAGGVVGAGQVDGPAVALAAGSYRVEVESEPAVVYDAVEVVDEETTELRFEPPPPVEPAP